MPKQNKSISKIFIATIALFILSFFLFVTSIFFKIKSNDKIEVPLESVIHQKDSTINSLQNEVKKMKNLYDNKHDTVIVYRTVFKEKRDTSARF